MTPDRPATPGRPATEPAPLLVHLIERATWDRDGRARPGPDGFVHLSRPRQIEMVANAFYREATDPILLCIDPERVSAKIRFEGADDPFPHLYGTLERDAVVEVIALARESDRWVIPTDARARLGLTEG